MNESAFLTSTALQPPLSGTSADAGDPLAIAELPTMTADAIKVRTYDISEGTEQMQQLVIARAVSGLRIE